MRVPPSRSLELDGDPVERPAAPGTRVVPARAWGARPPPPVEQPVFNRRCVFPKRAKEPYDQHAPGRSCAACHRPIKARLVRIKKVPPKLCYRCWLAARTPRPRPARPATT